MHKDLRKLLKQVEEQGFTWARTKGGHYLVRDADGRAITTIVGSASDWRALRNAVAQLKRAGFQP